jgi:hypothetical protein
MITLTQPSMGLNADGVPGPDYHMWNTWRVPSTDIPSHILNWSATVSKAVSGGKLNALVINCHARSAFLSLGTGIGWPQVPLFSCLSGLVNEIYLVACEVVSFTGTSDGNLFVVRSRKQPRQMFTPRTIPKPPVSGLIFPMGKLTVLKVRSGAGIGTVKLRRYSGD